MEHNLDVVSIWIEYERRVIARVVRALAGRAIVLAARPDRLGMETFDDGAVLCLKGEMRASGRLAARGPRVCAGHEELIGPEIVGAFAAEGNAEHAKERRVESLGRREVANDDLNVVDESASVELGRFHAGRDRNPGPGAQ